jgi:soluble lytic murein transglycosylase
VVDWIEQVPYEETRNYIQRVLENLQVYRRRLGGSELVKGTIEADLRRGAEPRG